MAINRVEDFISALKPLSEVDAIESLCNLEMGYLINALAPTSVRRAVSRYRNAIREISGQEHPALRYLRVPTDMKVAYERRKRESVAENLKTRVELHYDNLILRACDLINAAGYLKITLGLIMLTGRRPVEVLKQGKFYYAHDVDRAIAEVELSEERKLDRVNSPEEIAALISELGDCDYLLFSGQAKTRDSKDAAKVPFPIPVLTDPVRVLEAITRLRTDKAKFADLSNDEIHSRSNKELNGKISGAKHPKIFGDLIPADKCSCKGLRGAYAQIAYELFGEPTGMAITLYFSRILGHSENSTDVASHYLGFRLEKES